MNMASLWTGEALPTTVSKALLLPHSRGPAAWGGLLSISPGNLPFPELTFLGFQLDSQFLQLLSDQAMVEAGHW